MRRDHPDANEHGAGGKRKIGIPDREAEIVEGLAVILAADLARDHPVEIDLAAEGFGDRLAHHGDERGAERDESDQNEQDAENSDHGVLSVPAVGRLAARCDQRERSRGVEPAVIERAAGDGAFEPRIVGMQQRAHIVERGKAAARDDGNRDRTRERKRSLRD